jgi:hypothetical protein
VAEIVVIGAGFAGCSAAIQAGKMGAKVTLLERMDMLTGIGLAGGVMRNNGRFTATEEMLAMGGGEMFQVCDSINRHVFDVPPGWKHAHIYDALKIESKSEAALEKAGVQIRLQSRAKDVKMDGNVLKAVILDSGEEIKGDVFVDTTGTCGGMANCRKYGYGCVCCFMRCPTFGDRVGISGKAGVKEYKSRRTNGGYGGVSAAFHLAKESVDPAIIQELETKGMVLIPLPKHLVNYAKSENLTASQNKMDVMIENLCLVDNGLCKILVQQWMPVRELRSVKGFEYARIIDPYSSVGNAIRFLSMVARENTMQIKGLANVFCAGERSGQMVGQTEAIVTGVLAGYNAVLKSKGKTLLELPRSTIIGDLIALIPEYMQTELGQHKRISFGGPPYFAQMKEKGTYTTDVPTIENWVAKAGMSGIFNKKVS